MSHNRGKISKRRAVVRAELEKGEANAARNAAQRKRKGMGRWEDKTFPDGSIVAEPPTVSLALVVHDVEEVYDAD